MDVKPEISILWIAEWNVQGFHCFHLLIFNLWEVHSFKDNLLPSLMEAHP